MERRDAPSSLLFSRGNRIDSHAHNRCSGRLFSPECASTYPPFSLSSSFVVVVRESPTAKIVPGEEAATSRDEFVKLLDIRWASSSEILPLPMELPASFGTGPANSGENCPLADDQQTSINANVQHSDSPHLSF